MMFWGQKWPCRRGHIGHIKSTFSEYDNVANQIKGNEAYNNMLANILPLHIPLTLGVGSKGHSFSFLKVVMLHIKLRGMKHRTSCKQIFCHFTHPRVRRSKHFFSKEGHVAYQITRKEVKNIMQVKYLTLSTLP